MQDQINQGREIQEGAANGVCGGSFYVPIWLGHGSQIFGQTLFQLLLDLKVFLDEINI